MKEDQKTPRPRRVAQARIEDLLNGPKPRMMGLMLYDSKTAGTLVMVPHYDYPRLKAATARRGFTANLPLGSHHSKQFGE